MNITVQLKSSCLRRAAYDPASETLQLWFRSGGPYHFRRVPLPVFEGLARAASPGRYYRAHIRGRYRW